MSVPVLVVLACRPGTRAMASGDETGGHATATDAVRDASATGAAIEAAGGAPGATCAPITLSPSLQLPPAAAGQRYVRCATLGPERAVEVALSSDGSRLALRTAAGTVRLFAAQIGLDAGLGAGWREVTQIASPLGRLDAMAFSPDGAVLAVLSAEMGQLTLWRSRDGAPQASIAGPPASTIDAFASALAFSSDGARLATSLSTLIDVPGGKAIDWTTGTPVTVALGVNPENLSLGNAVSRLSFMRANRTLLVETRYQVGNSPPSTRLALHDLAGGRDVVLFDQYTRALNGFASSADGKLVALAKTNEAVVAGFPSGLGLFRADNGEAVVADAAFTGRVLGFSRNGSRLFTQVGDAVVVLGTADLREVGRFSWPAGTAFLGVSPGGWLVGAGAGVTSWWDPSSGKIVRQAPYALEPLSLSWSADGRLGVGLGGGALFHLWREADGAELCAPAPSGAAAPPLSSLGDTSYAAPGAAVAPGQPVVAVNRAVVHTHSSDWTAVHVLDAATGAELRVFGAAPQPRAIAIGDGGGRLFTEEGPDVAVWCR